MLIAQLSQWNVIEKRLYWILVWLLHSLLTYIWCYTFTYSHLPTRIVSGAAGWAGRKDPLATLRENVTASSSHASLTAGQLGLYITGPEHPGLQRVPVTAALSTSRFKGMSVLLVYLCSAIFYSFYGPEPRLHYNHLENNFLHICDTEKFLKSFYVRLILLVDFKCYFWCFKTLEITF